MEPAQETQFPNDLPPQQQPGAVSVAPQQESRRKIVFVLLAAAAVLCIVGAVCVGVFGLGITQVTAQKPAVEKTIDEFMRDMRAREIYKAFALFSTRAQRSVKVEDLSKMSQGNNFVLFDGYQSVTVRNLNVRTVVNADPQSPQGMVAQVDGVVEYDGGIRGRVEAVLEREGEEWRLHFINVTVPPDKLQ